MHWAITIGKIGGTAIRLHITFLLLVAWIAVSDYQAGGMSAARSSLMLMLLVFTCVVAHEFGHILMARRYGIKTPDVTLWPMGGVANMERIPEDPWQELPIAVAGPMVNAVIVLLLVTLGNISFSPLATVDMTSLNLLPQLVLVNLSLLVFNLVPAFPMAGGRALRALLAMRLGPGRATEIAVRVGRGFAVVFVVVGLLYNPILLLVGIFIFIAGDAELQAGRLHRVLDGLLVSGCMGSNVQTLSPDLLVSGAVERLLASTQASFPVIDLTGRPVGLLKRADLPVILKNVEGGATVSTVMGPPRIVQAATRLEDALRDMNNMRDAAEIVVDGQGRMIGLLTMQNIAELFLVRSVRPAWKLKMSGT